MSTDVRKRWKPLDSGNAISASLAAARLPCHRPCHRPVLPSRSPGTALRSPWPRGGRWARPTARGGASSPRALRTHGGAEEALSLPCGTQVPAPGGSGGRCCPVPSRPAERREPCSRELCSLCLGSSVGGGGAGGAGEGALRRKGKRRAPAPTQSQRTPPPRCGNSRICLQTCPPPTERKTRAFKVLTLIKARLVKDFTQCRKKFARA